MGEPIEPMEPMMALAHRIQNQNTIIEDLQETVRELTSRLRILEKLSKPTKMRREVVPWLQETVRPPNSYLSVVRNHAERDNLLLTLQRQGLSAATMALWTKVFRLDDPDCPLRSFNISPLNLYGYDGKEWKKVGPDEFRLLRQASEKWFMRAIRAEYPEGSEGATQLLDKVLNAASDASKLRTRLANYLRRSLKEIKVYEFEP